uniref:Uncharacterized protein n=1 Tax=Sander lucioperca TaxID=283035 RepID=A0A8D0CSS3_SANLU
MAAASCLPTKDQFLCPICLDVFTDPVATTCGHNYCKNCITQHWDMNVPFQCPVCKEVFYTRPELHQLIDPVENLEGRMYHKTHDVVPLKNEYEEKKAELGKAEAEIHQMIQTRRQKVQQIKRSVELSNEAADKEKADGVRVLTALKESVERSLVALIEEIEKRQRPTEEQAESFIQDLEEEISELMKRCIELEDVCAPNYEGTVVRAVNQLEEILCKDMKKVFESELKRVQQYAVDVTLDPDTANPWLILSDDGKQVNCGDVCKNLPDNPERFSYYASVLGKQNFTSGLFYYEVQVRGKNKWDLGVTRESIDRKRQIALNPRSGYWTISLRNENEYKALADPRVQLSLRSKPEKVGVFVDYEEGLVSFYDVDTAALIYSFTGCSFTEKLYPFFNPCNNDAVPL